MRIVCCLAETLSSSSNFLQRVELFFNNAGAWRRSNSSKTLCEFYFKELEHILYTILSQRSSKNSNIIQFPLALFARICENLCSTHQSESTFLLPLKSLQVCLSGKSLRKNKSCPSNFILFLPVRNTLTGF